MVPHKQAELCKKNLFFTRTEEPGSENCQRKLLELPKNIYFVKTHVSHFLSLIPGFYEGMLWKKGKDSAQFLKRKFVLSDREFTLSYYNKEDVSSLQLNINT